MVTEYIKRNQRMGYENGVLVYKVPVDEAAPVVSEAPAAVEAPVVEEEAPAEGE